MISKDKVFFKQLEDSHRDIQRRWPPPWIVTFSDLMTLLLTFFIFFFSVTTLKELPKLLRELKKDTGIIIPIDDSEFPVPEKRSVIKKDFTYKNAYIIENFKKYLKEAGLSEDIKLIEGEKELKVTISNPILFASGKSELKGEALPMLNKLAELFKGNDSLIRIEGHTDNVPIHTERFPSNWELSAARSIDVIRYFIDTEKLPQSRFEALGYGEFRPIDTNNTRDGRARNRRVEIKIIQ